jgi:hypothetical protein
MGNVRQKIRPERAGQVTLLGISCIPHPKQRAPGLLEEPVLEDGQQNEGHGQNGHDEDELGHGCMETRNRADRQT